MSKAKSARPDKNGRKKRRPAELALPPLPFQAAHDQLMKELAKMTPHEIFLTAVKSGIYTKSGKLRKPYR